MTSVVLLHLTRCALGCSSGTTVMGTTNCFQRKLAMPRTATTATRVGREAGETDGSVVKCSTRGPRFSSHALMYVWLIIVCSNEI